MEKKTYKLAPNGKRIVAFLIDEIIPFIVLCKLVSFFVISSQQQQLQDPFGMDEFGGFFGYNTQPTYTMGSIFSLLFLVVLLIAYIVVEIVFFTKSKSIGKAIMGLQVISSIDGKPLTVGYMLLRELIIKNASSVVFCLGYIWAFIDKKKRTWHDKILDSYVVEVKRENTVKTVLKDSTDVSI